MKWGSVDWNRVYANAFWCYLKLLAAPYRFYYPITSGWWCVHFQWSILGQCFLHYWLQTKLGRLWFCAHHCVVTQLILCIKYCHQQHNKCQIISSYVYVSHVSCSPVVKQKWAIFHFLCDVVRTVSKKPLTTQTTPWVRPIIAMYIFHLLCALGDPDRAGEAKEQLQTGNERHSSG